MCILYMALHIGFAGCLFIPLELSCSEFTQSLNTSWLVYHRWQKNRSYVADLEHGFECVYLKPQKPNPLSDSPNQSLNVQDTYQRYLSTHDEKPGKARTESLNGLSDLRAFQIPKSTTLLPKIDPL